MANPGDAVMLDGVIMDKATRKARAVFFSGVYSAGPGTPPDPITPPGGGNGHPEHPIVPPGGYPHPEHPWIPPEPPIPPDNELPQPVPPSSVLKEAPEGGWGLYSKADSSVYWAFNPAPGSGAGPKR